MVAHVPCPDRSPDVELAKASFPSRPNRGLVGLALSLSLLGGVLPGCGRSSPSQPQGIVSPYGISKGIPDSLTFDERVFAIGTDIDVYSDGAKFGKIEEKVLSWGTQFRLYDRDDGLIAIAKQRAVSWGVKIDIYDGEGVFLGTVKEKILESMFSIKSQYSIEDANGVEIADSAKLDFLGSHVTVRDKEGAVVADMDRGLINLTGDKWTVNFSGNFDRRLLVFIPAYKTAADNSSD
ncbi:MAG: hypothetical protein KDD64_03895 [Bdellovibrionales bacterium]|nr:hypothetical protein [Bdellovibrionales bacterium]